MALKEVCLEGHVWAISYEILHPTQTKDILFLHGWGSNKEIMKQAFSSHLKEYRHIYIDMPGFGNSPNECVLDTQKYAKIIACFLQSLEIAFERVLVVGHSFGGKVAVLLPVSDIVLLSSAGILEPKAPLVRAKIMLAKLANKLGLSALSQSFRSSDVANMSACMYETFKQVVNEDFTDIFKRCPARTLILWGEYDKATSKRSGEIIATLIPNSSFCSFEGDHYFFLKHAQAVSSSIQQYFSNTKEA